MNDLHANDVSDGKMLIDYMIDEVHELDREIRTLLRSASRAVGTTAVIGALAVTVNGISRDIALAALPILLTGTALFNLNTASEIAVMAEQRDRLCARVNRELDDTLFLTRIVADARRASAGTLAGNSLSGLLVVGSLVAGLINAWRHTGVYWWGQVVVSVVCVISLVVAAMEVPRLRAKVSADFDALLGTIDRPVTAPRAGDRGWKRIRASIFTRDGS